MQAKMEAATGATSLPTDAVLSLSSETSGVPAVMEAAAGATSLLTNAVLSLSSETSGVPAGMAPTDSCSVVASSDDRSHCGNITVGDENDVAVVGGGNSGCSIDTADRSNVVSVVVTVVVIVVVSVVRGGGCTGSDGSDMAD